ncbi:GDSL-type esterase/lipase family protein [Streptomyces gobitricini]|uniref:GDSL-type esterase/lipase family protein n=1 Tax=Streptomyces gobitricini TaxID=68211 RepID=UPI0031CDCA70
MRSVFRSPLWDGRNVPSPRGRYGPSTGPELPLLLLGDSSALTVGVLDTKDTFGAGLAHALATELSCTVNVRVQARAGVTTAGMARQVRAVTGRTDQGVALILIGGNDVMMPTSLHGSARQLGGYVRELREAGWQVVVGSCADIGAAPAVRPGVAAVATWRSHRLARRQAAAALDAGAVVVSLTTDVFRRDPARLYCPDAFHPSPEGYAYYLQRLKVGVLEAGRTWKQGAASAAQGDIVVETADAAGHRVVAEMGACFIPSPDRRQVVLRRYASDPVPAVVGQR